MCCLSYVAVGVTVDEVDVSNPRLGQTPWQVVLHPRVSWHFDMLLYSLKKRRPCMHVGRLMTCAVRRHRRGSSTIRMNADHTARKATLAGVHHRLAVTAGVR
jgi:hypothetical protein